MRAFLAAIHQHQQDALATEWALLLTATRGGAQDIQTLSRDLRPKATPARPLSAAKTHHPK
ncbi:MAG TPA: hypothetical protein PKE57_11865 [Cellvibrionaceae bacterium]|nr:hypothetical protein [Cellvibrionaceae bacterium]